AGWLWGMCAVIGTVAGVGYAVLMRRPPAEASAGADGTTSPAGRQEVGRS
ncbi:MFS transporter, partial [Streptomyces sp. TRM76130]|nr:MFS transporter [Streptomyces sp. TRM76130]